MGYHGPQELMPRRIETVIVGGGQAGLALSYFLGRKRREHVILERSRVAERWRSERWDSLAFQFPNWALSLPGFRNSEPDPDAFTSRDAVVRFLEDYAVHVKAPLMLGVTALRVSAIEDSYRFEIITDADVWHCRNVVLATGPFQRPAIPVCAGSVDADILQIHSRDYRNPDQFPTGRILVVGAGTSGAEIADELLHSGRDVWLCVGHYRKVPRRYRERDIFWWIEATGFWDRTGPPKPGNLDGVPLLTGTGGGYDIDLRRFAADGMSLLGRLHDIRDGAAILGDDLETDLLAGDNWWKAFKAMLDRHAEGAGFGPPAPDEAPHLDTPTASPKELNLRSTGISCVIWATGYQYDFGWVRLPAFNEAGQPVQRRGVTSIPGLYFLGLRRMHTIKSALLSETGVGADAKYVASHISGHG